MWGELWFWAAAALAWVFPQELQLLLADLVKSDTLGDQQILGFQINKVDRVDWLACSLLRMVDLARLASLTCQCINIEQLELLITSNASGLPRIVWPILGTNHRPEIRMFQQELILILTQRQSINQQIAGAHLNAHPRVSSQAVLGGGAVIAAWSALGALQLNQGEEWALGRASRTDTVDGVGLADVADVGVGVAGDELLAFVDVGLEVLGVADEEEFALEVGHRGLLGEALAG